MDSEDKLESGSLHFRNTLNITKYEYKEFVGSFSFFVNFLKSYLNENYFKNGIKFPYNPDEIYTSV